VDVAFPREALFHSERFPMRASAASQPTKESVAPSRVGVPNWLFPSFVLLLSRQNPSLGSGGRRVELGHAATCSRAVEQKRTTALRDLVTKMCARNRRQRGAISFPTTKTKS